MGSDSKIVSMMTAYIDLSLELCSWFHRTCSNEDLATFHLFTFDAAEEGTHVVASLTLTNIKYKAMGNWLNTYSVQFLMEHL